jgi:general secretion pathway protein F
VAALTLAVLVICRSAEGVTVSVSPAWQTPLVQETLGLVLKTLDGGVTRAMFVTDVWALDKPGNKVPSNSKASAASKARAAGIFSRSNFNATKLAIWTRQIAGLISSGLPLERALTALTDEAEDEKQRNLIAALRAEVNAGSSFARALGQHPREFSEIYIAVIGAGEQSGHLGGVLERLADDLEESQALKAKLIGAALYPAIVTVIAIAIVIFLVSYVVPQVASVFAGTKRALPFPDRGHAGLSAVVRQYGWAMLLGLVLIAAGGRVALGNEANSGEVRRRLAEPAPGGPPVPRLQRGALCQHAGHAGRRRRAHPEGAAGRRPDPVQPAMRADALDALVLVREGAPLASALAQKKRFPGLLAMFARLGEQTGQLPLMLQRAAAQLSTEVQRLEGQLVVAISSRALFDFEEENRVFEQRRRPRLHAAAAAAAGAAGAAGVAFSLVRKLLAFNDAAAPARSRW